VASNRYDLAHKKYAPFGEVFSLEILGHLGLEENRAAGEITFHPEQWYLTNLQNAFKEFLDGLRDLVWLKDPKFATAR